MSIYDHIAQQVHSTEEQIERMGQALYDSIEAKSKVLDVGCSSGYFADLLIKEKQCVVDGIEIDENDIAKAKNIVRKIYTFDIEDDWAGHIRTDQKYDAIIFGDVLEHLKDPEKVLTQSKKYLSQGGVVLVSIPNIAHISIRLELLLGSFEYKESGILDKTHLKYFTLNSFTNLAKSAGFKVERINFSLNDYSNRTIQKILNKAGLDVSDSFWKLATALEARAFQYKFVLRPTKEKSKATPSDVVKPDELRNNEVEELYNEVEELYNEVEELYKDNRVLKEQITNIKTSRSYKLALKLSALKKKFRLR